MKIAVIGGGISGLTAAHRLSPRHEVTIFEASHYLGGHAHTVDVPLDGKTHAVDTGFMVFNEWTYPHFIELINELGITSRPTEMGFSVHCQRSGLEYSGASISTLFAQRRNLFRPRFHRMLLDILRFNHQATKLSKPEMIDRVRNDVTVGEFLREGRYSKEFAENYLLPMGSAIWSCPMGRFSDFPIRFIIEFYRNHGLLNIWNRPVWRTINGGSRSYVQAIVDRFKGRVRLRTPIDRVRRLPDRVDLMTRDDGVASFDHVIFACHSDQALHLLADASATERELLSAFPYERSIAVLHTDESLLPKNRRAWASWNYHISDNSGGHATVTYCLNILQHIKSLSTVNLTLNDEHRINPDRVLNRFVYEHPVFNIRRSDAQARHAELIDNNRTSYCGAYWRNGFHEDGVVSALQVCRRLEQRRERRISAASELCRSS
jgi:predicted NAD/FAD-binding protein